MSHPTSNPATFIASLLTTLSSLSSGTLSHQDVTPASQATPLPTSLSILPESARSLLLTLHVLFPHCLLDALDSLDRGLVVRLDTTTTLVDGDDAVGDVMRVYRKEQGRWFVLSSQMVVSGRDDRTRGDGSRWRRGGSGGGGGGGDYGNGIANARGYGTSARYLSHSHNNNNDNNNNNTQHASLSTSARDDNDNDNDNDNANANDAATYNAAPGDLPRGAGEEAERGGSIENQGTSYHVHLTAWNCSCPAFAFAAFAGVTSTAAPPVPQQTSDGVVVADYTEDDDNNTSGREAYNRARSELSDIVKRLWQSRLGSTSTSASTMTATIPSLPFGGLSQSPLRERDEVIRATCKHLLACLLAESCPNFFIPARRGGRDEVGDAREGRKGVMVKTDCGMEEVAAWAGGGVFV